MEIPPVERYAAGPSTDSTDRQPEILTLMPLTLTLIEKHPVPLEVDNVTLAAVRELSAAAVSRILIQYGNQAAELGQMFHVTGSAADQVLIWQGDCSRVKRIGARHETGQIRVEGNAGMHLGAEMTGGEILVTGDVDDWAGAELHGGRIVVRGNAGDLVGAVYRGGRRGMTGGEILIHGHAGSEIGHTMRRGLIAVGGNIGDATGFNLIAGTVLTFGAAGLRPGAGMRRGTLAFLGDSAPKLLPTFKSAGRCRPEWLRFYLLQLRQRGFPIPEGLPDCDLHRHQGDFLESGQGEILTRAVAG